MTGIDLTGLCERLAQRNAEAGIANPVAAAVSTTARGTQSMTVDEFADAHGYTSGFIRSCEQGDLPFSELPDAVSHLLQNDDRFCLLSLADLEANSCSEPPRPGQ